ncbi:MAG: outer membrane protein assembly factor BamD [Betaproteobacteria bacterium]|nr:outer membrane protein assembly factor BamD [Betaproteobacteria bacterium]
MKHRADDRAAHLGNGFTGCGTGLFAFGHRPRGAPIIGASCTTGTFPDDCDPVMARCAGGLLAATLQLAGCGSTPARTNLPRPARSDCTKEAREDMESGSYERARSNRWNASRAWPPVRCWRSRPLLDTAYLNWRGGERAAALTAVDRFIKLNPSSPALDYALYLRGVINFIDNLGLFGTAFGQDVAERDQQAAREAWQAFKQLVDQFPQSRYAPDAWLRMNHIVNALAAYEVHVARYFPAGRLRRRSARRRPLWPSTRSRRRQKALHIMVESYDKLALTPRDDAARAATEFPQQHLSGRPRRGRERAKPWWKFW